MTMEGQFMGKKALFRHFEVSLNLWKTVFRFLHLKSG